ncbi:MAG: glycerol-3-phosphate dehydrogenase [Zetaproteobacteria bacterium]|nr:glycerol-3-phosphate dehydrogenase [Pseudobdellovibrionaceae bacterium]
MHENSLKKILVLGTGNFGTCLAYHLAKNGHDVLMWAKSKKVVDSINSNQINPKYLSNLKLPENLSATDSLNSQTVKSKDIILLCIPTQSLREVLSHLTDLLNEDKQMIVCAAKGIEISSKMLPSQLIVDVLGKKFRSCSSFLSGPSFAVEVAAGHPTAVTLAGVDKNITASIQKVFHTSYFRVYSSEDPVGIEIAGAMKNVIAIAAGACHGLGFKSNSLAALITRGLAEITRLGVAMGANTLSFKGLGGVGDLFLTCSSSKSRNYTVGYRLAQGEPLTDIVESLGSVAEGVFTAKAAHELGVQYGVRMPITEAVYKVLYKKREITQVVKELISSSAKDELE